jgi:methylase of polypeptide subunit release factors
MTPPESAAGAVLPRASAGRLVADAAMTLRGAGIPSPRLDAELLVGHAFGRDRAWLHAHPDAELGPAEATLLAGWIERRSAGEPIAYIRGFKEWLSLRIATDARALIPRPETELLVEAAITEIAERLAVERSPSPLPCAFERRSPSGAFAWLPATCPRRRSSWPPRTSLRTGSEAP